MPLYLTEQDEKNLKAFKALTGKKTDGGSFKRALAEYPELKKQVEFLNGLQLHNRMLFLKLKQAIQAKADAETELYKTVEFVEKNRDYKPDKNKSRQTSIHEHEEEEEEF